MSSEKVNIRSIKELKYDDKGLIPAVIQDFKSKDVLMVAYMNEASIRKMLKVKKTCFWSRSRRTFWIKGETSGHFQFVKGIYYDCDKDCLLIKVRQVGVACHTGNRSCFYRKFKGTYTSVPLNKETKERQRDRSVRPL